jgi:hypothetical protein
LKPAQKSHVQGVGWLMYFPFVCPFILFDDACFLSGAIVRFIPAWFPGAGFQRKATAWREEFAKLESIPHAWARKQIVRVNCLRYGSATESDTRNLAITKSRLRPGSFSRKMGIRSQMKRKTL